MTSQNMSRVRLDSLRVSSITRPGYHADPSRVPEVGEAVCCVEGQADVVRVLGRVSDGSRLLELRLYDRQGPPFFAASSNVLLRDRDE